MAGPLVKVLLDTSVYIPFLNRGISIPSLEDTPGMPLLYMSAVVMEELYAGAYDRFTIRLLDKIFHAFDRTNRLIIPNKADWQETGKVIARIGRMGRLPRPVLVRLTHDTLIALAARRVGAVLYTKNIKDFQKIQVHVPFRFLPFDRRET
jgi:predicted nucleic acid-binding protein